MKANKTAATTPPATASSPPANAPKIPFAWPPAMAPLVSDAPKPIMGTFIPAFATLAILSKTPIASRKTPTSTKETKILAEVILVLIIKSWPIAQINPPTKKTIKYVNISPP